MAVIRKDLEKEKALDRVEKALEIVKNYRKCIELLKGDAEISVIVKPTGGKRGARVDAGLENDAARLSAIMVGVVKRMAKTINRDAAKFDIELSEDELASLSFDESEATSELTDNADADEDTDGAGVVNEEESKLPTVQSDESVAESNDWPDLEEGERSEHQEKRFFGF